MCNSVSHQWGWYNIVCWSGRFLFQCLKVVTVIKRWFPKWLSGCPQQFGSCVFLSTYSAQRIDQICFWVDRSSSELFIFLLGAHSHTLPVRSPSLFSAYFFFLFLFLCHKLSHHFSSCRTERESLPLMLRSAFHLKLLSCRYHVVKHLCDLTKLHTAAQGAVLFYRAPRAYQTHCLYSASYSPNWAAECNR